MTRAGIAAAAAALVAILWAAPGARAERSCTPVVHLSGDPSLVAPVAAFLRERGIALGEGGACGVVNAAIARTGERLVVRITDVDGAAVERVADDTEGAATAIESWARADVAAPLLAARAQDVGAQQSSDTEKPDVLAEGPPVFHLAEKRTIEILAAFDTAITSDRGWWAGIRGEGRLQLGAVSAGVLVRYARDTEQSGDSKALESGRSALDILLVGDVPLSIGRLTLSPGGGVGQTAVRGTRETNLGLQDESDAGLHLRAHVGGAYALGDRWSLRLDTAFGYSPWVHTRFGQKGDVSEGETVDPEDPLMAGAPRTQLWLGFGLSYGGL